MTDAQVVEDSPCPARLLKPCQLFVSVTTGPRADVYTAKFDPGMGEMVFGPLAQADDQRGVITLLLQQSMKHQSANDAPRSDASDGEALVNRPAQPPRVIPALQCNRPSLIHSSDVGGEVTSTKTDGRVACPKPDSGPQANLGKKVPNLAITRQSRASTISSTVSTSLVKS